MRPLLLSFLLIATVLAGCADDPPPETCDDDIVLCDPETYFGDHPCEQADVRPRVYAPDTAGPDTEADPWVIGDSWTYSLELNGEDLGETELIYYGIQDAGAHYMVGTPTREEALQHAVFSTNPVIGRVHKTLYSPHESGAHADMFQFPLCDGSTWEDTFFDTRFTFTAQRQSIALPDGRTDPLAFRIDGRAADGSNIQHTYSPMAKWFTRIDLERADGSTVNMQLTDLGSGHSGSAFFLRGQQDHVQALDSSGAGATALPFGRSGEGQYSTVGIAIDVERTEGSGRTEVHVRNPDGTSVACVGFAGDGLGGGTDCPAGPLLVEVPYADGEWEITVERQALAGETRVIGDVRVVSIQDRSCAIGGDCGA